MFLVVKIILILAILILSVHASLFWAHKPQNEDKKDGNDFENNGVASSTENLQATKEN